MHYNRHNPYFNRWFSAIKEDKSIKRYHIRHNPYFNRWFSAIKEYSRDMVGGEPVTILILIDGFLQCNQSIFYNKRINVTILILIDGFLQLKLVFMYTTQISSHNPYFNRWFSAI